MRIETVAPGQNEVVDTGQDALDLPSVLRQGAFDVRLAVNGAWDAGRQGQLGPGRDGWRGTIDTLDVRNRQAGVALGSAAQVAVVPGEPLLWSVGQTNVQLRLPGQRAIVIAHRASSGSGTQWRTSGAVDGLTPAWLVAQLPRLKDPLRVDLDWDLTMGQALAGTVNLTRRSGDLAIPGTPPLQAGLTELRLRARATPTSGNASTFAFDARVAGKMLGSIDATGTTTLTVVDGVPTLAETQPVTVDAKLAIADIAVFNGLVGDTMDIGGRLAGDVRVQRQGGVWAAGGPLTGSGLRVVLIDEGIRLLDGTLSARLANGQLVVDSLRFPGVMRAAPRDSRIQAWLKNNAAGSAVEATGAWSLESSSGQATVTLTRFPLVQRADRFIAGSGKVDIVMGPNRLDITGKAVADVGWISLEGASDVPSLASDIVIVRAGDEAERATALPMRLDLEVDLGRQFYLRGMGLDTALEGSIRIRNTRAGLRANGVVNTREGRFSIYGQTLVVRKGAVTFQGLLDDPLLDIIAVREGVRIEAGVQVSGTVRQPIISLVSYPDVPEVEKLSWLLLGRGPDASGADAGMLLAAAASLLGDEDSEPIYRQLGLDELGLRSGLNSGLGGLLPERTVVGSVTSSVDNNADAQFLVIGKRLNDALYLTFEQALSGSETVVRASYQISERLTAAVQGGTINGLRLVWSLVFDD
ncbi:translocation/assembly module TamB domain-containing protein [Achromobacter sp. GG226]|nr:translocation/assembly module TamB domain-containing protein [Verticiella sp. GG226]